MDREVRQGFGAILLWGIGLIIVGVLATLVGLALYPKIVDYRSDVNRQSQGYTETKQTLLLSLVEDYYDLEADIAMLEESDDAARDSMEAQQKAIVERLHKEAALLEPDEIPSSVREFLREHPSR